MKLILGFGNPEERYARTRHNVGFRVLDAYANAHGTTFQLKDKFHAHLSELQPRDEKIILAKPTTYYNNVGAAARAISDFYKIVPQDILIIHDELALPFGTIRTRIGGSDAGNNGVKSLSQQLGPDTARIRIGVTNELRERIDDADFVLANFTKAEDETLPEITKIAGDIIDDFISGNFHVTTH